MKRLLAMVLIGLFCATGAFAAEWGEGLGPDQPLPGVRKLDLNREMGYSYTYPRPGLEVSYYCNVLEIYLPREDIALGDGHAHLYDSTGEVADIDFANPDQVHLRPQQESELAAKKWGSGVCIEMYLPVSRELLCADGPELLHGLRRQGFKLRLGQAGPVDARAAGRLWHRRPVLLRAARV